MVDKFDTIAFQLTNSISIHNYSIYSVSPSMKWNTINSKNFMSNNDEKSVTIHVWKHFNGISPEAVFEYQNKIFMIAKSKNYGLINIQQYVNAYGLLPPRHH